MSVLCCPPRAPAPGGHGAHGQLETTKGLTHQCSVHSSDSHKLRITQATPCPACPEGNTVELYPETPHTPGTQFLVNALHCPKRQAQDRKLRQGGALEGPGRSAPTGPCSVLGTMWPRG